MAMATRHKSDCHSLDSSYRILQPGETVREGDYMQIGRPPHVRYSPVCSAGNCRLWPDCGGVGHVVDNGGAFDTYWRKIDPASK
jgi:hypothetical protein